MSRVIQSTRRARANLGKYKRLGRGVPRLSVEALEQRALLSGAAASGSDISGVAFLDLYNSKARDQTDRPLAGIVVTLTGTTSDNLGTVREEVTTAADGSYNFTSVSPGHYELAFTVPHGFRVAEIIADSIAEEYVAPMAARPTTVRLAIPESGGMRWTDTNLVVPDISARMLLASTPRGSTLSSIMLNRAAIAEFVEDTAPVLFAELLGVTKVGSQSIQSATASIINLLDSEHELLAAETAGTNLSAEFDASDGVLRITGTDTIDNYQKVLHSLTYENRSEDPNPAKRAIKIAVSHGTMTSRGTLASVLVQPVNDAPNLFPIAAQTAIIDQALSLLVVATDPEANDLLTFQLDPNHSPTSASIERIDSDSARIHWTPSDDDLPGPARFRVLVTDDGTPPAADSEEFLASLER